jgi:autotransporter passenger strand-loop-strand repeat protein
VASGTGFEQVYSGGVASDTLVEGNLLISGGTTVDATLRAGDIILFAGTAIGTVVESGATQYGGSDSTASGTVIDRGGIEYGGAVEQDPTIAGGSLFMASGTLEGTVSFIGSGGLLRLSGTNVSGAVISGFLAGDAIEIDSFKYSAGDSASVVAAGVVAVSAGGQVFDIDIAGATTAAQGFAISADVNDDVVLTTVFTSAMTVSSGVTSQGITRTDGETIAVLSGGAAVDTAVSDFGALTVSAGGTATGTMLGSAGFVTIDGGRASATSVGSGGLLTVVSGGHTYRTVVHDGGDEYVASGIAANTRVLAGGHSLIGPAGEAVDPTIAGGQLEVAGAAKLDGTVTFDGRGELVIDSPKAPSAVISGFGVGDVIAFGQVYYGAGDTVAVKSAGIVTISASGETYNLHIAGATVGSTDYALSEGAYGLKLTVSASAAPAMAFLRPAARDAVKPADFSTALVTTRMMRETETLGFVNRAAAGAVPDFLRAAPGATPMTALLEHGKWFG